MATKNPFRILGIDPEILPFVSDKMLAPLIQTLGLQRADWFHPDNGVLASSEKFKDARWAHEELDLRRSPASCLEWRQRSTPKAKRGDPPQMPQLDAAQNELKELRTTTEELYHALLFSTPIRELKDPNVRKLHRTALLKSLPPCRMILSDPFPFAIRAVERGLPFSLFSLKRRPFLELELEAGRLTVYPADKIRLRANDKVPEDVPASFAARHKGRAAGLSRYYARSGPGTLLDPSFRVIGSLIGDSLESQLGGYAQTLATSEYLLRGRTPEEIEAIRFGGFEWQRFRILASWLVPAMRKNSPLIGMQQPESVDSARFVLLGNLLHFARTKEPKA